MLCVALVCPTVVLGKVRVLPGDMVKIGVVGAGAAEDDPLLQPVANRAKRVSESETATRVWRSIGRPELDSNVKSKD
jgi:hypothetical protein